MSNIINVARGFEKADLVIKNANIVNVLSEEIIRLILQSRWHYSRYRRKLFRRKRN